MTSISIDPGWDPAKLAERAIPLPNEQWRDAANSIPRHSFIPRWWEPGDEDWILRDGPAMAEDRPGSWFDAIDADRTIVTRVGPLHAEDAAPGDRPTGPPTEEGSAAGDVVCLFDLAEVRPGCTVLLADAGSGYEAALLARQLGPASVTVLASVFPAAPAVEPP